MNRINIDEIKSFWGKDPQDLAPAAIEETPRFGGLSIMNLGMYVLARSRWNGSCIWEDEFRRIDRHPGEIFGVNIGSIRLLGPFAR